MTGLVEVIDEQIAIVESALVIERAIITSAIETRQIGEHYWQKRVQLERKLAALLVVRDAVAEALS
ncbi:hypothetical protein [Mesorhizobium sp. 8]|uniref:hypothetical protein n=1 Tax=Mesorhizobium sp. 8 TaxID=2584466 RepID=UPI00111F0A64|nr:hypothetical protein [Mesorhizobium sp. 8]QDC00374.1 hypothetical protein FGU64_08060 [Mesorhizobium sp. 8]